ncbi:protein NETWORKED 2A-like [Corylus avellana]|uniref:protein NETWORKED 2A-like n=1 Tax=Corylus avellana TaxID=13451 RepID=UPI00286AB250|nr:protein NETWORKED 2A-like [Corylus avellana]
MLQRAASNAYSWWWASHVRTKQSRWLEENLQDLEEKVRETLKIIDNDGDSFRERAEMYYKKRPELINFVEEAFRAYRALAERYDLLSRQLQTANRTIATVFPEHAQYAMDDDDDDDDEENLPGTSTDPNKPIPKVPKIPEKDFRSQSMLISRKKGPFKRAVSSAKAASGMSKSEALQEIDKLQKETLALQTEKEFVQSLYERVNEKYWEIENKITDTQKRVCGLEDEFGIEIGIDDDEARTLMAATALKSCEQTLVKLQEKQEESAEDARVEHQRIKDVHEKFATIKNEFVSKQTDGVELKNMEQERHDMELERENVVEEQVDVNSRSSLSVMELAEKIDDLVKMVVTLETAASSETALVETLRSETDELQEHIQRLEGDKENLVESSENMGNKLKELEEELRRVKILNTSLEDKNNNLQTHFSEANNLSGKLQGVEQDKEDEDTGLFQDVIKAVPDAEPENGSEEDREKIAEKEEKKVDDTLSMPEKPQEPLQQERDEKQDSSETVDSNLDVVAEELEEEEEEDQPIWKKMFVKGLEDREKIILDEYTSVLGNNKLLRKKLSEVEKKNKDSNFELEMQIRELKSAAASKDEMIQSLLQKLSCPQPSTNTTPEYKYVNQESISQTAAITEASNILLPSNSDRKTLSDLFGDESTELIGESPGNSKRSLAKQKNIKVNQVDHHHAASSNEEKFRSEIDDLLEENLEFWLRFSTSVHEIQKFQTSVQDLHAELQKVKDKKQEGSGKNQSSKSDLKPIYRHLREIQTEVSLWLEHNAVLKEDLLSRLSSLCSIQENLSRMSKADYAEEKTALTAYQAGKFQGEILNMKQENSKVSNELQAGLNRVTALKVDVERTLEQLDEELGITASKKYLRSQPRIPLRSFLFGVKVKKQKPSIPSFFPCANPALQKQYSDLAGLHV